MGRQTAVRPRPGSGRTDCLVENIGTVYIHHEPVRLTGKVCMGGSKGLPLPIPPEEGR